ncbi:hypothetical protein Gpo141_00003982 [Globisporangium polare]
MGCSRPGALAVACVTLAGGFTILSLFLPYWSKITIVPTSEESSANASVSQLELTFGIWGSCLTIQTRAASDYNSSSSLIVDNTRGKPVTSFTCASYFDTEVVGLQCTGFSGVTGGDDYSCTRITNDQGKSLCASETPLGLLLIASNSTVDSNVASEWLGVVDNACGGYGKASAAMACITVTCTGLAFVLLVLGITCGSIESGVAKAGSVAAITTAFLQSLLGLFWHLEANVALKASFATSYYLNVTSVLLLAAAFVATKTHTYLGKEAQKQIEVDFMLGIDEKPPNGDCEVDLSKNAVGHSEKANTIAV